MYSETMPPGAPGLAWLARESQGSACLSSPAIEQQVCYTVTPGFLCTSLALRGKPVTGGSTSLASFCFLCFVFKYMLYFPRKSYTLSRVWEERLLR